MRRRMVRVAAILGAALLLGAAPPVTLKDVLEARTKNIQASRSRTENFISSV